MKRKIALLYLSFIFTSFSFAQKTDETPIKRNSIYFEFFGQGLYNSFSFDRLYRIEKKVKTSFTVGITLIPFPKLFVVATPISYNFIFGKRSQHLELGLGFTPMYLRQGNYETTENYTDKNGAEQRHTYYGHNTDFYSFLTPKIGYRFQRPTGGFFMRLTFTPPIAGINILGPTKGGDNPQNEADIEFFSSAAFFDSKIFPWAGISLGYTLKK